MKLQEACSIFLLLVCFVCGCDKVQTESREVTVFIPAAPNYNESKMWYVERNDQGDGVDVFYIPSTWEFDWKTSDSLVSHYADPSLPEHRAHMETEMIKVAEYMASGNNFYSPHYRHITLNSWVTLNEDTIAHRYMNVSFKDVKAAFHHFLINYNQGRPFILARIQPGWKIGCGIDEALV